MKKYLPVILLSGLALCVGCTSSRSIVQRQQPESVQASHEQPAGKGSPIQPVNNEVEGSTPVMHLNEETPAPTAWQKLKNWSSPQPPRIPLPRAEDVDHTAEASSDFHAF